MKNFTFHNPTKLVFGKGALARLQSLLPADVKTILLLFGGGSVVRNGIYDQVLSELSGYRVVPFGGIEPNPDCTTIDKAILVGREEKVDLILAVGGGSVLDASKVIAAGVYMEEFMPSWEMVVNRHYEGAIPLGTVLTVPATGSEMNSGSVISNRATEEKFSYYSKHPLFSILDPLYTYTLSGHQVSCGIADAFMHTLEQYLTYSGQSGVMDRMAEGILLNILDFAPKAMLQDEDYDAACEYMLSATIALNGFLRLGVVEDWVTHQIGHEITALTGTTHGASLMMILPWVMRVLKVEKESKLLQFGERVYGIREGEREERISRVIEATESFIHSLGLATSLKEANISTEVAEKIAQRFETRGGVYGENGISTPKVIREILMASAYGRHPY